MSIKVNASFKPNMEVINKLEKAKTIALEMTGEALRTDLVNSQTMPMETGNLQNDSTFVDTKQVSNGKIAIVSSTPYARRLYFHPEFNFRKDKNPNAGGRWLDPYLKGGAKQNFVSEAFRKLYAKKIGGKK